MEKFVIVHVKASELPEQWSKSIKAKSNETFTVTLAPERGAKAKRMVEKRNPLFGIWADRRDLSDVGGFGCFDMGHARRGAGTRVSGNLAWHRPVGCEPCRTNIRDAQPPRA